MQSVGGIPDVLEVDGTSSDDTMTLGFTGASGFQITTGDDLISGGTGKDAFDGGLGEDVLKGGTGSDTLQGGSGNHTLMGGNDGDSISGGADNGLILGDLAGVEFNATGSDGVDLASGITDFPTTALTFELMFSSTYTEGDTSLGSYAVAGEDNEFSLHLQAGTLAVCSSGAFLNTGIAGSTILDGSVNALSVIWDSAIGAVEVYLNGANLYSGKIVTGAKLDTGGTFAIGQDQDSVGGGFFRQHAICAR